MSKVYVISDLHLGHDKLAIKRGFESADEQDNKIIEHWNSRVKKRDVVWILGDIAMNRSSYHLLDKLKGTKNIVLGNHDLPKYSRTLLDYVNHICGMWKKSGYIFTHCPIHESQFYRFKGNVHGHLHDDNIDDDRYINVSCEQLNYTPMPIESIVGSQ